MATRPGRDVDAERQPVADAVPLAEDALAQLVDTAQAVHGRSEVFACVRGEVERFDGPPWVAAPQPLGDCDRAPSDEAEHREERPVRDGQLGVGDAEPTEEDEQARIPSSIVTRPWPGAKHP